MKNNKTIALLVALSILSLTTVSCNAWLAVDLEDSILEDKLFETNEGYKSVLNGVYTDLNTYYGSTLSMGTIDVMAKLYNIGSTHSYHPYFSYDFEDETFESASGSLWTGLYKLIANLNVLLEKSDEEKSTLFPNYYPYVKGEALALRAMLHFDLLRLYGPIYTEESKSTITIPYQATTDKTIQPLLSAEEIVNKVIKDLTDASELLKDDVIRTDGVLNSDSEDPNETADFRYRQFRLNYYAIQGLLARAYLWKGDQAKAYATAKAMLTEVEEKKTFDWTPKADIQTSTNPDLIFSSEVIFSLYNLKRVNLYNSLFKNTTSYSSALTFAGKTMEDGNKASKINWFFDELNDLRRTEMWEVSKIEENQESGATKEHEALFFNKYKDIQTTDTRRYMIPLLRISEIYLIAAETCTSLAEGLGYVNIIREHRNCVKISNNSVSSKEELQKYIDNEFYRETIGEGQIYFYYKRHAKNKVLGSTDSDFAYSDWYGAEVSMTLSDYVWPLPTKVEKDKRLN